MSRYLLACLVIVASLGVQAQTTPPRTVYVDAVLTNGETVTLNLTYADARTLRDRLSFVLRNDCGKGRYTGLGCTAPPCPDAEAAIRGPRAVNAPCTSQEHKR